MEEKQPIGFLLFNEIRPFLLKLTDEERGRLFLALVDYSIDGTQPQDFSGTLEVVFMMIQLSMDRSKEKWTKTVKARSVAGRKSAAARAAKNFPSEVSCEDVSCEDASVASPDRAADPGEMNTAEQDPTNPALFNKPEQTATNSALFNKAEQTATNSAALKNGEQASTNSTKSNPKRNPTPKSTPKRNPTPKSTPKRNPDGNPESDPDGSPALWPVGDFGSDPEKAPGSDPEPPAPEGGAGAGVTAQFGRFWEAYPRKVGKQEARKVFQQLILQAGKKTNGRSPPLPALDRLIAVLEEQKRSPQWQREGGRFIPYPATWLRQARWEDEPTTTPPAWDLYGVECL